MNKTKKLDQPETVAGSPAEKKLGIIDEFKAFISRGNVLDFAVGVIIGGALTGIVNSFVKEIFMPIVGVVTGGIDYGAMVVTVIGVPFHIGNILTAIINFLLIAMLLFAIVKAIDTFRAKTQAEEQPAE